MRQTKVHHLWRNPAVPDGFTQGVSLHSHTTHSRESLEFIPQYAHRSAFLSKVMDLANWQYTSRTGKTLDFTQTWWTPPLSPQMAVELEASQISKKLNLAAMVSLTDHDNCQAGLEVDGPVSIEWTIPCPPSFFHLGVHNLPRLQARSLVAEMNAYTHRGQTPRLLELLCMLNRLEGVLIVLNHPLWDEGLIGGERHAAMAAGFLRTYGHWIHALELNGLRSPEENERVCALAVEFGLPVVSGGDRHGREPNANLNLTRARTFSEFVYEIRHDQLSHVLYMPQYREPLRMRQFETAWDILRHDGQRADGRHWWSDRVFFTTEEGITRPLSYFFGPRGPKILMPFLAVMRLLEQPAMRPVLKAALGE